MKQTMREHQQIMEEQQQKKDEEHQKMMQEQQRNLVEQQERRMQLMEQQMREQIMEQIRQLNPLQWEDDAGSIRINGTDYFLEQGHWHSPSEHSINGRRYDLELHMVHVTEDPSVKNKIAVVGLFYKIGQPDAFLSKLMRNIASMAEIKAERNMGVIDPREIKMGCKR
ncbi:Bifunctional monodehydroascorbate reductase and carbonic anhydrase nectarin-3 [Morella rubra]|uniref:Carbonic anhydrase n=1 Tax=Morella rubra TaxID=262757 RepID=A0A6A1UGX5_9ROSI|nr:Bifunctional monodehydroascorbate reductase and carbonic anhydrase nectarin-3 [Morella rubra]